MNGHWVQVVGRRWLLVLMLAFVVAVALAFVAPPDAVQGRAQRLMYVHVPVAWSAYLCFGIVLVASLQFLRRGRSAPAAVGRAAGEIGVALTVLTLMSGSLWGSLTWGTWWVWDARVTATVAMGLVYVAYLAARVLESGRRSRVAAALIGVAGFAAVPVVHFSVVWWRALHQPATILAPELNPPIDEQMALALAAALAAVMLLVLRVLQLRVSALRGATDVDDEVNEWAPPGAGAVGAVPADGGGSVLPWVR